MIWGVRKSGGRGGDKLEIYNLTNKSSEYRGSKPTMESLNWTKPKIFILVRKKLSPRVRVVDIISNLTNLDLRTSLSFLLEYPFNISFFFYTYINTTKWGFPRIIKTRKKK